MATILSNPVSHEGYLYRFERRSADDGKFWRCLRDGCQGRIKTDAYDVFIEFLNSSHKHPCDPDGVAVKEIMTTLNLLVLLDFVILTLTHCHCRCLFGVNVDF